MLSVGSVVAGYRIQRVLGAGGMGTVYLARNPDLPRSDALKVLSGDLSRDLNFRNRFIREADVAASLDHPNIVGVYRRGQTDDGQLWIAMQFVDGTDADAALEAGTMTPARAVHIVGEVGKALDYAHHHNVVHRDVKPGNFLLSGEVGRDERVLLGDFGIARALDDVGLTITGTVMATVSYAAPEILSGAAFDGRADLYSLGCTLFRMLTGKLPFSSANGLAAVMMAHLQQPPPRVTDQVPGLPAPLDWVIATAMAKDPALRFQSARELADAAAVALTDRAATTTAPWQPISSADVSSYPLAPGKVPSWWQHSSGPRTAMAPAGPPLRPRRRHRRAWIVGAAAAVLAVGSLTAVTLTRQSTPDTAGAGSAPTVPTTTEPAPATDVADSALKGILLRADEIPGNATGDTVVLEQDTSDLLDDSATIDDKDCLGAWAAAQNPVYAGSGWTGAAAQVLRALNKQPWQDGIVQAAIAFPSPGRAKQLFASQSRQWGLCAKRSVTVTPPGESAQTWQFNEPATTEGTLTMDSALSGGGARCQRGLAVRGNVVIDVRQCREQGDNAVAKIIAATAARVPRR